MTSPSELSFEQRLGLAYKGAALGVKLASVVGDVAARSKRFYNMPEPRYRRTDDIQEFLDACGRCAIAAQETIPLFSNDLSQLDRGLSIPVDFVADFRDASMLAASGDVVEFSKEFFGSSRLVVAFDVGCRAIRELTIPRQDREGELRLIDVITDPPSDYGRLKRIADLLWWKCPAVFSEPDLCAKLVARLDQERVAVMVAHRSGLAGPWTPSPGDSPGRDRLKCRLRIDRSESGSVCVLDEKPYPINDVSANFLSALIEARGEYLSAKDFGFRPDHHKKKLRKEIKALLEPKPGAGTRLRSEAWNGWTS